MLNRCLDTLTLIPVRPPPQAILKVVSESTPSHALGQKVMVFNYTPKVPTQLELNSSWKAALAQARVLPNQGFVVRTPYFSY